MNLTYELLKHLIKYEPETGLIKWVNKNKRNPHKGEIAGGLSSPSGGKRYVNIKLLGSSYRAHRLAYFYMTGSFPDGDIDHINGNGTDNRWVNLRCVDKVENARNSRMSVKNKSGVCGVSWYKNYGKWHAQIKVANKKINLGYFDDIYDAAKVRKEAEKRYGFHPNHGTNRPL